MPARLGRLHVITDEVLQTRFSHGEIAALVTKGGADAVQYREKRPKLTRELIEVARAVNAPCEANGATCIVDDRVDVAEAVNAGGLHLGKDDLPIAVARKMAPGLLIGGTANSLEEARRVWQQPLDYIGVGPIYGTQSKANPAPVMGLETLHAIASECPVPVIAIGSITASRAAEVLDAGAHGVAVISAITCAEDPGAAAREFMDVIEKWLGSRTEPAR